MQVSNSSPKDCEASVGTCTLIIPVLLSCIWEQYSRYFKEWIQQPLNAVICFALNFKLSNLVSPFSEAATIIFM